jgi:phospholipid/cholesterol/gamma-HCH transport system permease protein
VLITQFTKHLLENYFTFLSMDSTDKTSDKSDADKPVVSPALDRMFVDLHNIYSFVLRFFKEVLIPPYEWKEIIKQFYEIGVRSLPLIALTGFITGIVFTNQSRPSLAEFGATSWLPSLISVAIVRAMAPLVTALIAAGRVGSSIGAELGSMKVTEQIDAMEVSAINPFKFLIVSRVLATSLMLPALTVFTIFVALLGGYINVHQNEATSFTTFFDQVFGSITFLDIFSSIIKSFVFGFTIGIVGCYKGYHSSKGTEGVGKAANSSVVTAMFLIFIEELLSLQIINAIRP